MTPWRPPGLGQQTLAFDLCDLVNAPLKAVGGIRNVLNAVGCCTPNGKRILDDAIKAGLAEATSGLDETTAATINSISTSVIRGCLCQGTNCGGVTSPPGGGGAKSYLPYIIGGVAVLGIAAFALTRKKRS